MIAGTADGMNAASLGGAWPKHQGLLWEIGHCDWFSFGSGLHPCDPEAPRPACRIGWLTAAEMPLTFMVKHLKNQRMLPSHQIGPSRDRTALRPYYDNARRCGLRVRWVDPLSSRPHVGNATIGFVPTTDYPWSVGSIAEALGVFAGGLIGHIFPTSNAPLKDAATPLSVSDAVWPMVLLIGPQTTSSD